MSPVVLSNKGSLSASFILGRSATFRFSPELDVAFASVDNADYAVCTGLFDDERETPDSYRELLATMQARSLFMVCANPDIVVERGDDLVYCAGALADAYGVLGGEVLYCGKPHAPIYEAALGKAAAFRGGDVPPLQRVLAIGNSVPNRSQRRRRFRRRLFVCHLGHPRRRSWWPRGTGSVGLERGLRRGGRGTQSGRRAPWRGELWFGPRRGAPDFGLIANKTDMHLG